jgi:transcriptional regulator with XRE-family HTH domain
VKAGREANTFVQSVRADLATHRKFAGLNQEAVGRKLDLSQSAVSKIEKGDGDLSLKTLHRFAEAIGYRPVVLMIPSARATAGIAITGASPRDTDFEPVAASHETTGEVPSARAVAVEEAQVALLRRMSDVMPEVLAGLSDPE